MANDTIIQALFYLAAKLGKCVSKLQFLKLMYFADKLHLIKYGRTITGDRFVAMSLGTLGSTTYDVLKDNVSDSDKRKFNSLFNKIGPDNFQVKKKLSEVSLDWLSATNKQVLTSIVEEFGKEDAIALSNYSHTYPEWFRHEKDFQKGIVKVKAIPTQELLSVSTAKERLPITRKDLEQAKALFADCCF